MGARPPDAIVAGLEPNFYVTEANVICLDGKLKGRTMFVSLPLCRILSLGEMRAVLGHELAHYKGLDTRFSQRFYPIYRGATQGLVNIASGFSEKGGAGQLVLLPAFATLSYFLDSFSESEKAISRERELAADKEAANIDSARNLAIALAKLHALFRRLAFHQAGDETRPWGREAVYECEFILCGHRKGDGKKRGYQGRFRRRSSSSDGYASTAHPTSRESESHIRRCWPRCY